jgi:casein kinase 1
MATPHVIASSSNPHQQPSPSYGGGIVGTHYRVGKKIGEGSFGIVFEGKSASHPDLAIFFLSASLGFLAELWLDPSV